jgi:hypothetical protein
MSSTSSCDHEIFKYRCIICTPKNKCQHNKYIRVCIKCNPKLTCEHNKRKSGCVICYPNMRCEHDKSKYSCKLCKTLRSRSNTTISTNNIDTKSNIFDSLINAIEYTEQMHINNVEQICIHKYVHADCIYCYMMELKL